MNMFEIPAELYFLYCLRISAAESAVARLSKIRKPAIYGSAQHDARWKSEAKTGKWWDDLVWSHVRWTLEKNVCNKCGKNRIFLS